MRAATPLHRIVVFVRGAGAACGLVATAGCSAAATSADVDYVFPDIRGRHREAEAAGAAAAERDIAAGRAGIRIFGRPGPAHADVDPDTGLRWIREGCVITPEGSDFADGYNTAVRDALAAGRLTSGLHAAKFLAPDEAARRIAEDGRTIPADGTWITGADGRFALRLADGPGSLAGTVYVWVRSGPSGEPSALTYVGGTNAAVAFLCDGTVALVDDPVYGWTRSVDLETGLVIQVFRRP